MTTTVGILDLRLRRDFAPVSVANFLSYANSGRYDGTFFNRAAPGFVLQAGALRVVGEAENSRVVQDVLDAPINQEPLAEGNSNRLGTVAFVRSGPQGLATNQFFFNLADNPGLDTADEFHNVVYNPFAELANDADRALISQIAGSSLENLQRNIRATISGGLSEVPVRSPLSGQRFQPARDLFLIQRVAVRMSVEPVR
ncbi:MAG: peptidylprolyl isomerase [Phycisphaerae bacterium]|nr:peptidylprolyl isomerase [Phycisphaerae bacterium]